MVVQCTTVIEIGERAMFGQSTIVLDGQHRFRDITRPMLEQGYDFHELRIADDATVTTKCTIMADIGEHAFVGANSVVTRPVPAFTPGGGCARSPDRVLRTAGRGARGADRRFGRGRRLRPDVRLGRLPGLQKRGRQSLPVEGIGA